MERLQQADSAVLVDVGKWIDKCRNKKLAEARAVNLVASGGTDYDQNELFLPSDDYGLFTDIVETDPDTSSAWTVSGLNAAEFGIKLTT